MSIRRPILSLVFASLSFAPAALADGGFKDLQVLPKTIGKDELKAVMKAQSKSLGVDCDHCHEMPKPETETKNKKIARDMMRMTNEINTKFIKSADSKVTCGTCHRGKEKPEVLGK